MVFSFCVDISNENGLRLYKLQDYMGNTKILMPMELQKLIEDKELFVINLTKVEDLAFETVSVQSLNDLIIPVFERPVEIVEEPIIEEPKVVNNSIYGIVEDIIIEETDVEKEIEEESEPIIEVESEPEPKEEIIETKSISFSSKEVSRAVSTEPQTITIKQILSENADILEGVLEKDCLLYKHMLFYIQGNLKVFDWKAKKVTDIDHKVHGFQIFADKIMCTPFEKYIGFFIDYSYVSTKFTRKTAYYVRYDIENNNYKFEILNNFDYKFMNVCMGHYYNLDKIDILTLTDENEELLPYFMLFDKESLISYNVDCKEKENVEMLKSQFDTLDEKSDTLEMNITANGMELVLDGCIIKINKDSKKGELIVN